LHVIALLPVPSLQLADGQVEELGALKAAVGVILKDILLYHVVEVISHVFVGFEAVANIHVIGAFVEELELFNFVSSKSLQRYPVNASINKAIGMGTVRTDVITSDGGHVVIAHTHWFPKRTTAVDGPHNEHALLAAESQDILFTGISMPLGAVSDDIGNVDEERALGGQYASSNLIDIYRS
jgi:hypothetical protein